MIKRQWMLPGNASASGAWCRQSQAGGINPPLHPRPKLGIMLAARGALQGTRGRWARNGLILGFCLLWTVQGSRLAAQTQPFSSSVEYKSMLAELQHDPVRPSRMSTGTLLRTAQPPVHIEADETAGALRLETVFWRLEIRKNPWQLALTNKQTGLTWRLAGSGGDSAGIVWAQTPHKVAARLAKVQRIERHGDRWRMQVEVAGSTETATLTLTVISPTVIRLSVRAPQLERNARMGLNFAGAGPFFGLGERFDQVKLDGLKTVLHPEDLLGKPGHNWTYIPIPFLFTPHGLGIYLDAAAVSTFDLSRANKQTFSIQLNHPSADAYLFIGAPKGILEDYTSLTGRSPLPPPWAFGVWICSYQGPGTVLADARRLRKDGIPASAIWTFDVMGKGGIMGWPLWWTGYYPHPRQFTNQLHKLGFKVLTYCYPFVRQMLNPYILPNPSFQEGLRKGFFVLNSAGQPTGPTWEPYIDANIDFTNPTAVDWWQKMIQRILLNYNFDGWMEDFGEWVKPTDRFAAGVTGRKMENLNPLFYHKITYEIARKAKPDVVEFDRSGYAGSQGYTRVVWGGDQLPNWTQDHGLPSVVKGGITAGLSGFDIWGPDIEGNGFSKELWTRWVEFGALTPIMRNHLWDKPYFAVDLWFDQQTIDTFRRYARLHISLFPYFYTYAHEAAKTGLPVIRHLMLEWPDDPNTYNANEEYLLGEKILVAPVVKQGATTRSLYLPKGSWVDYWTGQITEGGRQVTVPAPLEHIPILVQAGSVIPLLSPQTQTLAQDLAGSEYRTFGHSLIWRVFPASMSGQSSFTLYDGTHITADQEPKEIQVKQDHSPLVRAYELVLPAKKAPRRVTLSGEQLNRLDDTSYHAGKKGWWLNPDDGSLRVLFSKDNFELNVTR